MNVNLSVRQLRQPRLIERILEILDALGLPPHRLKLEVTESMLMDDPEVQIAVLHRLREAGIGVVIDDFGTGYSSLGYLQRFEFDVLKIDRSFLPTQEGAEGWDIVRMILGLACLWKMGPTHLVRQATRLRSGHRTAPPRAGAADPMSGRRRGRATCR